MSGNDLSCEWDSVYKRIAVEQLPWYGINLPDIVKSWCEGFDRSQQVVVTGCGVGDTAEQVRSLGFDRLLATEVSPHAVRIARERFPNIRFIECATEQLDVTEIRDSIVLDWLVLHHVPPTGVENYFRGLRRGGREMLIGYFISDFRSQTSSHVKNTGTVYFHDPEWVASQIQDLSLNSQTRIYIDTNIAFSGASYRQEVCVQTFS